MLVETGEPSAPDRKQIEVLKRRRDYLADWIEEAKETEYSTLSYDRAEVAALNWALDLIRSVKERGGLRDG